MKFMNIILLQCNLSELNPELTEILCKQNFKCSPKIWNLCKPVNFKQHNWPQDLSRHVLLCLNSLYCSCHDIYGKLLTWHWKKKHLVTHCISVKNYDFMSVVNAYLMPVQNQITSNFSLPKKNIFFTFYH